MSAWVCVLQWSSVTALPTEMRLRFVSQTSEHQNQKKTKNHKEFVTNTRVLQTRTRVFVLLLQHKWAFMWPALEKVAPCAALV